ncbi:MAG TPA: 30S ribosomal protein S20 [Actinomycetota bacterium]|nr:30S ribosomal protein S20 [Actinomycetota bacterium]
MANIKSQKKRILTNEKARVRNKAVRTALKTYIKRFNEAIEAGDKQAASEALQIAARELDRAAAKGVIHANNAANRKSSLTKRLNATG